MKGVLIVLLIFIITDCFGQTFEELTTAAAKAGKEKNYRKAIELYNKALKLDAGNYFIYHKLSLIYFNTDNFDSSIVYCNLSLKTHPNDSVAMYQRGHSYMEKGEFKNALADFTQIFEKSIVQNSDVSFNIGKCYFKLGNIEKAIKYYNTTLLLEPKDKYSFYELGFCYASMAIPDKDKALKYYTQAIEEDSDYYEPYFNRGLLYATQFKNLKKAHSDLEKSIEIMPKNKLSYFYNGILYRDEENYGESKEMFNRVIELYPDYGDAYYERALTWYQIGILNMVCRDLDKAESLGYTKATEAKKKSCK